MTTAYPLDETGVAESNVVTNETHSLHVYNSGGFLFVIPVYAPFFETDLVLTYTNGSTSRQLDLGIDYVLGGKYMSASIALEKGVYSTICITNPNIVNNITITRYHTLGGLETLSTAKRTEALQDVVINPIVIYWEQLANVPELYQATQHYELFGDILGQKDLINSLEAIAEKIQENQSQITQTDLDNLKNYVLTLRGKPRAVVNTYGTNGTLSIGSVADHKKTHVGVGISTVRINAETAYTGSSDWYVSENTAGYSPKPMPIGGEVSVINLNAENAPMTVVGGIGVAIHTPTSFVIKRRGTCILKKIALNQWVVSGDMESGSGQSVSN